MLRYITLPEVKTQMEKKISGFDNYLIDEEGNVFSIKRGIYLKPVSNRGYPCVALYKDGKRYDKKVHRLVAEAFIPNPNNLPQVNHKDENPNNCKVENLEWCDAKYNNSYGTRLERVSSSRGKKVCQYSLDGKLIKE